MKLCSEKQLEIALWAPVLLQRHSHEYKSALSQSATPSQTAWTAKVMWIFSWHDQITNQRINNELSARTAVIHEQHRLLFLLPGTSCLCRSHTWVTEVKSCLNICLGIRFLISGKNIELQNNFQEKTLHFRIILQNQKWNTNICGLEVLMPKEYCLSGHFPPGKMPFLSHENSDTGPGDPTDKPHLSDFANFHPKFKSIHFYRGKKYSFSCLKH